MFQDLGVTEITFLPNRLEYCNVIKLHETGIVTSYVILLYQSFLSIGSVEEVKQCHMQAALSRNLSWLHPAF